MGVLEYTGEQQLYIPDPNRNPPLMLGERLETPRHNYGIDYLRRVVSADNGWFTYGDPPENVFVYQPELYAHTNISSDHMYQFWYDTFSRAPDEALAAVGAIRELARADIGERRIIFEAPFETWGTEDWVPHFVDDLQQLLSAHHAEDIIRDDRQDTGADPNDPHYTEIRWGFLTEIRWGFLGVTNVFLVTRSRIAYDDQGREVLTRLVELVKPDPKTARKVLDQLSLPEHLRLLELLIRCEATDDEWTYVLDHADRRTMQRDHHSVAKLIGEYHAVPVVPRWRKVIRIVSQLINRVVDSQPIDRVERALFRGKEAEDL